jgi:hypothetical protein
MLSDRCLRTLLLLLPRATCVALFATIPSGCTTHFKILKADVVSAQRPAVEIHVETDLDIEAWAEPHVVRSWKFVILEEQSFDRSRGKDPVSSEDLDALGRALLDDDRMDFSVFMGLHTEGTTGITVGIEALPPTQSGRYRYRIVIPYRRFVTFSSSYSVDVDFRGRSDAYILEPNHTYTMWGRLTSYKMVFGGIKSSTVKLQIHMK